MTNDIKFMIIVTALTFLILKKFLKQAMALYRSGTEAVAGEGAGIKWFRDAWTRYRNHFPSEPDTEVR